MSIWSGSSPSPSIEVRTPVMSAAFQVRPARVRADPPAAAAAARASAEEVMARQGARPPAQLAWLSEVVGEPACGNKAAADRAALELAGGAGGDGGRGQVVQAVGRDA